MSNETTPINWYKELTSRVNTLAESMGLDDVQTSELRTFVTGVAKDQFKVGNKSGAAWAFKQAREGSKGNPQPSGAI